MGVGRTHPRRYAARSSPASADFSQLHKPNPALVKGLGSAYIAPSPASVAYCRAFSIGFLGARRTTAHIQKNDLPITAFTTAACLLHEPAVAASGGRGDLSAPRRMGLDRGIRSKLWSSEARALRATSSSACPNSSCAGSSAKPNRAICTGRLKLPPMAFKKMGST